MQKAVLVGVETDGDVHFEYGMEELKGLAEACEMEVAAVVTQKLPQTHAAYYVGTGKIEEIRQTAELAEADCIVFDNSLKPSQQRNLQKVLDLPVMDRTNLILEIFGKRARTREARLQVESANLQYMLPQIVGDKIYMSAKEGIGFDELLGLIREKLFHDYVDCKMLIPYTDGAAVAYLKEHAVVHSLEYEADGALITLLCSPGDCGRYKKYLV